MGSLAGAGRLLTRVPTRVGNVRGSVVEIVMGVLVMPG